VRAFCKSKSFRRLVPFSRAQIGEIDLGRLFVQVRGYS
jgi:hypothetical protein